MYGMFTPPHKESEWRYFSPFSPQASACSMFWGQSTVTSSVFHS